MVDSATSAAAADEAAADAAMAENGDEPDVHMPHALPMKLNARSANPALDVLKKIDYNRAVVQHLEQQINDRHRETLRDAETMYQTPEDLLADRSTSARHVRQRVEECLRLVKVRNVSVSIGWCLTVDKVVGNLRVAEIGDDRNSCGKRPR